jgi:hypothetical protein
MIPSDPIDCLQWNSVLLDNTTFFAAQPLRIRGKKNHWTDSDWAKHIVDWGMSNLVDALVLYDAAYVDGHADLQCPILEQIAEQFDGIVRCVEVGDIRTAIFSDLNVILKKKCGAGPGRFIFWRPRSSLTAE